MIRLRLLVLLTGAGALLAAAPAPAQAEAAGPADPSVQLGSEAGALALLTAAARAARSIDYAGTQYVATWRGAVSTSDIVEVSHRAGEGNLVRPTGQAGVGRSMALGDGQLDLRLLGVLAETYDLVVADEQTCSGRAASVVEARRADGGVAGRFWLDEDTSLVLRREVYDRSGQRVRSAAFVDLRVAPAGLSWGGPALDASFVPVQASAPPSLPADGAGRDLPPDELDVLRRDGWVAPATLPGGLELFAARHQDHAGTAVLHLAYSDGLSTLSVFAQPGELGARAVAGHRRERVGRTAVWVRPAGTERMVWSGGGRVWTVVSDAPTETVRAAIAALPADEPARTGVLARLARGLSRLLSWINPFD